MQDSANDRLDDLQTKWKPQNSLQPMLVNRSMIPAIPQRQVWREHLISQLAELLSRLVFAPQEGVSAQCRAVQNEMDSKSWTVGDAG